MGVEWGMGYGGRSLVVEPKSTGSRGECSLAATICIYRRKMKREGGRREGKDGECEGTSRTGTDFLSKARVSPAVINTHVSRDRVKSTSQRR